MKMARRDDIDISFLSMRWHAAASTSDGSARRDAATNKSALCVLFTYDALCEHTQSCCCSTVLLQQQDTVKCLLLQDGAAPPGKFLTHHRRPTHQPDD